MARLDAYPPAAPLDGTEVTALAQQGPDGRRHTRSAPIEDWIAFFLSRVTLPTGGGGGGAPSEAFIFTQSAPNSTWVITHNQGRYPQVRVFDTANSEMDGDVSYPSNNQIVIRFSAPFAGVAYCG